MPANQNNKAAKKDKVNQKTIRKLILKEESFQKREVKNSYFILEHTHGSAQTLLRAFDIVRKRRKGGSRGGHIPQIRFFIPASATIETRCNCEDAQGL